MRRLLLLAAFALIVVPATVASADPIAVGDTFKFTDGPGNTGGGEFGISDNDSQDADAAYDSFDSFVSFCVQKGEYMNFSDVFRVSAIAGQDSSGHSLTQGTAWLYREFSQAGYGAIGAAAVGAQKYVGNQSSANGLQKALWYLQGQPGATLATVTGDAFANVYYNLASAAVGSGNLLNAYAGTDVQILQVVYNSQFSTAARPAQDQLVYRQVPEPASLVLFGFGLVAIASRLRRRV